MDNVYTLNEIVQGRLREDKKTYAFFLDIQKAYDSVWHDGLWYKLWDMGVKGRMWRVIKKMYESSKSAVLLEGEKSDTFTIEQGVAQGCSLSPILFSVFVNDLLKEVEQTGLGIQLSSGKTVLPLLNCIPSPVCSTSFNKSLTNTENNMGDKLQPWATPCSIVNVSDFSPSKSTALLEESYIFLFTCHILPFTPMSHNLYHKPSCHTES